MKGKRKNNIFVYITAALVAFFALITAVFGGWGNLPAFADNAAESAQTIYEKSNVLDDLQGSTIGGEKFDIKDYPYNAAGELQVLSFVEFCYSADEARQGDFGLYVYVYNPQEKEIEVDGDNAIQFVSGGIGSVKRGLTYLNYSAAAGSEGRFYKFKINLSSADKSGILRGQSQNERVYKVVEIELLIGGEVKNYSCKQTYTFTGFAKGYGSELATEDTLSCTVDGLETVLSLDVHPTYYRPKGTHADGVTRDTLHSVYFSVPNEIIEAYGEMTAVHATWLNAYTAPIFVTGNKDVYDALYPYLGQYVDGGTREEKNANTNLLYSVIATLAADEVKNDVDLAPYGGYYAYNAYRGFHSGKDEYVLSYTDFINCLSYIFYADGGNADNFTLSAEELLGDKSTGKRGWFEWYTEKFGGADIFPPYERFKYSWDLLGAIWSGPTDKIIEATDTYQLQDNIVSNSGWDRLFGKEVTYRPELEISAIKKVTGKDIDNYRGREIFCDKFYVDYVDYEAFSEYVRKAEKNDETTYLFRYYVSEYRCVEATEYERTTEWSLFGSYGTYKFVDTNAYFAQMWVQLDFDIIDVTYTKDGVSTVIPVAMSPIDIAADVQPPVNTTDDSPDWWSWLMAKIKEFFSSMPWWGWLIIGLVALSVLMPLLSLVFPAVGTVLAAVVKGLVQIFKYLFIGLWYIVKYLFIGLWYIISAPMRLVVWIVRKVRGG